MRGTKLCVCGRSHAYPVCDDSHLAEGSTCASNPRWAAYGFCTSHRYQNLAKKLASHHQGLACLPGEPPPSVETLVTIVDGTDLDYPLQAYRQIHATDRVVVTLGVAGAVLSEVFPGSRVVDLGGQDLAQVFKRITALLQGAGATTDAPSARPREPLRAAFVSHAVADEALIMPAIDYARRYYGAELFTCSDSIPPGANWQASIMAALAAKDLFVLLLSAATEASHFCSFEIGVAVGLAKPMAVLSLDGSRPPLFVQQLHAIDIPRIERQKPWLERHDIVLDALLRVLEPRAELYVGEQPQVVDVPERPERRRRDARQP
jgi:TIR domain